MSFETLAPRLQAVAQHGLRFFALRFGRAGLKVESEIDEAISWKPSFHVKQGRTQIVSAEVTDVLYPEILKGAAYDILHYQVPISIYIICALEVYQGDNDQAVANSARRDGFGIITINSQGQANIQAPCVPLAQHISDRDLEEKIRGLTPNLKVRFKAAHQTYQGNVGQGLQEAGQIVEEIVRALGRHAHARNWVSAGDVRGAASDLIDKLFGRAELKDCRAALGGVRDFLRSYRNLASHPARTGRGQMEKIRACREGFFNAMRIARDLKDALGNANIRVAIRPGA